MFGLQLEIAMGYAGRAGFFVVKSAERERAPKRGTLCAPRETLPWFTLLSSLLQYNSQATNIEEQERKSIHKLKIYCQVEQPNNSFSTQFPFRCSRASLAELWKGNMHMKMKSNNSNSS